MSEQRGNGEGSQLPAPQTPGERQQALAVLRQQALSLDVRSPDADEKDEIDLLSYWRILVKRRWTVLGAAAIVVVTALIGTLLMTPIYRSTALLQIDRDTIRVLDVEGITPVEGAADRDFYQTQYELLQSRALAQRVASQLDPAAGDTLESLDPPSPWAVLKNLFRGENNEGLSDAEVSALESWATRVIMQGLTVEPVRNSRLVRVHFDSPDPEFSQRAASAIADAFIASNLERRFDSSSYAKTYLEDRLQELKLKLEDSERQLVEFAQREQIVTSGEGSASLSQQNLGSLNAALAEASRERIRAEARWRQAQASTGTVLLGEVGENSIIKSLLERKAALQAEYQDK